MEIIGKNYQSKTDNKLKRIKLYLNNDCNYWPPKKGMIKNGTIWGK